ncbi:MAG: ComEA family DNA-binding protein [Corynebacterium glucuronolyticum]|nr:ComEA family DNA-binding protein [Corynebacterium glucuronolyticum]MDD7587515.1 ComEA family DNA-binding protein [Mycobacteriaceae bacterium]MDY5833828.1 ComEA family DNA-binding protein [Corynebacterium glucuronolyticum]
MNNSRAHIADRLGELQQPTGTETHLNVLFPRITIDSKQAILAVAVIAVGLCFFLVRGGTDSPQQEYTAIPVVETSAPPTEVVVSVVGAVENPGLITLPEGSRVADALAQAHPQSEANLLAVNQAQKLIDGIQITVPTNGPVGAGGLPDIAAGAGVSLNSATASQLEELDGVGAKTAAAIIAYREQTGGFSSIEQLQDVKGIGPATFDKLKDKVTL